MTRWIALPAAFVAAALTMNVEAAAKTNPKPSSPKTRRRSRARPKRRRRHLDEGSFDQVDFSEDESGRGQGEGAQVDDGHGKGQRFVEEARADNDRVGHVDDDGLDADQRRFRKADEQTESARAAEGGVARGH